MFGFRWQSGQTQTHQNYPLSIWSRKDVRYLLQRCGIYSSKLKNHKLPLDFVVSFLRACKLLCVCLFVWILLWCKILWPPCENTKSKPTALLTNIIYPKKHRPKHSVHRGWAGWDILFETVYTGVFVVIAFAVELGALGALVRYDCR